MIHSGRDRRRTLVWFEGAHEHLAAQADVANTSLSTIQSQSSGLSSFQFALELIQPYSRWFNRPPEPRASCIVVLLFASGSCVEEKSHVRVSLENTKKA